VQKYFVCTHFTCKSSSSALFTCKSISSVHILRAKVFRLCTFYVQKYFVCAHFTCKSISSVHFLCVRRVWRYQRGNICISSVHILYHTRLLSVHFLSTTPVFRLYIFFVIKLLDTSLALSIYFHILKNKPVSFGFLLGFIAIYITYMRNRVPGPGAIKLENLLKFENILK